MNKLIYNQKKIPKDQWRYGLRSSAATGCGWIAAYNALQLMGYHTEPEKLIRYYKRHVPGLNGTFGTFVMTPVQLFRKLGFEVKVTVRRSEFDDLAKSSDACILFYHWIRRPKFGAHFAALQYRDGQFTGYNTYKNSTGPDGYGESIEEFISRKKYFGTVLIGIRDRRF
ncbi:MAG: hypothetical protein IKU09_07560 [Firmicutes bacterium]|nr:hypothetical protein [Bacillota bacterium]